MPRTRRFTALTPEALAENPAQYFPLSVFFEPVAFSREAKELPEAQHDEIARVQQKFLETLIPIETFESEDRGERRHRLRACQSHGHRT